MVVAGGRVFLTEGGLPVGRGIKKGSARAFWMFFFAAQTAAGPVSFLVTKAALGQPQALIAVSARE